jgi:hypothetical protein
LKKKNQKTFDNLDRAGETAHDPAYQKFLRAFLKSAAFLNSCRPIML